MASETGEFDDVETGITASYGDHATLDQIARGAGAGTKHHATRQEQAPRRDDGPCGCLHRHPLTPNPRKTSAGIGIG